MSYTCDNCGEEGYCRCERESDREIKREMLATMQDIAKTLQSIRSKMEMIK